MASKNSKYVARDQVFTITLAGLMPLTTHYVYYESNLVPAANIKPSGKMVGDPVKTDLNGQVVFDFYVNGGTVLDSTPFEQAQNLATKLVSSKQITVANKSTAVLPIDFQTTFLSYASFMIGVNVTTTETTDTVAAIYKTVEVPWSGPPRYEYAAAGGDSRGGWGGDHRGDYSRGNHF